MPETTLTYLGEETVDQDTLSNLKIEKVYERLTKEITTESLDGENLFQLDLGQPTNLLTIEGYCTTLGEKQNIKKAMKQWYGDKENEGVVSVVIEYPTLGGNDTMTGTLKGFTCTYVEDEKQWKYTIEIAEYI